MYVQPSRAATEKLSVGCHDSCSLGRWNDHSVVAILYSARDSRHYLVVHTSAILVLHRHLVPHEVSQTRPVVLLGPHGHV